MLESIKRWIGNGEPPRRSHAAQAGWAQANGWRLRGVRDADGFVIEGRSGAQAWRLEWGPSQRHYIEGNELRLRAELEVPRELQALVLDRGLMETMEKTVFDQYVEGVQTRIDTTTPPEMRWLVMFAKLSSGELGTLREGYGALSSYKPWLQQWIGGPLAHALAALPAESGRPLVLMIARRRLCLRTALAHPDTARLDTWLALFATAVKEAQRVVVDDREAHASTQPSLFSASVLPTEALRKG